MRGREWTPDTLRAAWPDRYVVSPSGCHEWSGARDSSGYGHARAFRKAYVAHRLAYELFVGPIPDGMVVMHQCDNPCCVNPAHLKVGTQADNMRDKQEKDRGVGPPCSLPGPDWPIFLRKLTQLGLSQRRIAKKFGTTPSTVARTIKRAL